MYLLPCHGENKENKDYHCSLQSVCSSPVLSELLFTDEIFTKQFQAEIVRASDYETDSHAIFKSDLEFRLQEPLPVFTGQYFDYIWKLRDHPCITNTHTITLSLYTVSGKTPPSP